MAMPKMILYFSPPEGTTPESASADIQSELAAVGYVESARAEPLRTQAVLEIIAFLTIATKVVVTSTAFLEAVSKLVEVWKKLRDKFPTLPAPELEIGLRRVPIDQITNQDAEEAAE
jgi:hypothetical protein